VAHLDITVYSICDSNNFLLQFLSAFMDHFETLLCWMNAFVSYIIIVIIAMLELLSYCFAFSLSSWSYSLACTKVDFHSNKYMTIHDHIIMWPWLESVKHNNCHCWSSYYYSTFCWLNSRSVISIWIHIIFLLINVILDRFHDIWRSAARSILYKIFQ
jgi:hypothetical protein